MRGWQGRGAKEEQGAWQNESKLGRCIRLGGKGRRPGGQVACQGDDDGSVL